MKLLADIQGDIRAMMKQELEAAERAVMAGVSEAASGLQTAWRGQITGAALGQGLANSIRRKLYPTTGASIRAAAVVYSNASKVVDAFDHGALIRAMPDQFVSFGEGRFVVDTVLLNIRLADAPALAAGDTVEIAGQIHEVQGTPTRDTNRLSWRAEARAL